MTDKEKLIKAVKRACPEAIDLARRGAHLPGFVRGKINGKRPKKHIKRLLTKYYIQCCMKK